MQTAVGVFGGGECTDVIDATPLMNQNVGDSSRSAISSQNSPPFTAVELCREHLVCDNEDFIALEYGIWAIVSTIMSIMFLEFNRNQYISLLGAAIR